MGVLTRDSSMLHQVSSKLCYHACIYILLYIHYTGECFGNIISNNQIIQTVTHHSVSFGIRNKEYVIGIYMKCIYIYI